MILLDTHVVLWGLGRTNRLGPLAHDLISRADKRYVSAVTHVEFRITAMKGKLHVPDDLSGALAASGLIPLAFTEDHARSLDAFPQLAGHDPFDRMLLAQATSERLEFLTADPVLLDLGELWIIDARR